jgi:two-component system CitB family sensor kinase
MSLATQLFLLQVSVVAFVLISGGVLTFLHARGDNEVSTQQRVLDVAQTLARSRDLEVAFAEPDPARRLQPLAESVRLATGVDFVVIMNRDGVRYSHPNPAQIGGLFIGHVEPALHGRPFTETYTGTLGPSVRAVVPVYGTDAQVDGLVSVGITRAKISEQVLHQIPSLAGITTLGFGLAALGALLVSRRLRRQTLGLGAPEITRMYEHHDAVLHAVREGLLVFGRDRRLLLANDEAIRLLGLRSDDEGRPAMELELPESLREVVASGRNAVDEIHLTDDRTIVINQAPAMREGRTLGTVTTLRDHTELKALSGELDSVRGFAEALRAQAHEAANRLHTVVSLIELNRPDEAVTFATAELAAAQELTDRLLSAIAEPVLAALLLGKAAEANERGVEFLITEDTGVVKVGVDSRDLVTLVGNLVDNAIEAALEAAPPRKVTVTVRADEQDTIVCVRDSGDGLAPDLVADAFTRGWSTKNVPGTKSRGLGLALVRQVVTRHGGTIDVTRDEGAVFTVRLPEADAMEDR